MFLTRSEYDRGVNTFSPEGRLFQVEYAIEAIKLGSTVIGISTSEGVVLAAERRITSPLMEPTTIEKIVEVDKHIGCAGSGLMADSRTMIDRARAECQNHWFIYNEKMTVESVAQAVSNLAIQFGDSDDDGSAMSRPFGVAILFAGIDEKGPQLFHMDPSGTFILESFETSSPRRSRRRSSSRSSRSRPGSASSPTPPPSTFLQASY
ncbi:hypothetical protein G9C98_000264 [Cotesia typhae]|uniref:Proteasome subunit alpha type n=1 Tax=Cotesia typhae TaxID=2053667 RepID=A0A8J5RFM4_9HYME|nr:hypothetical protein G9C98_000264 [Cotesia typhae]